MRGAIAAFFSAGERGLEDAFARCLRSRELDVAQFDAFRRLLLHRIALEERVLFPALLKRGHPMLSRDALRKDHVGLAALCVPLPDREWVERLGPQLTEHAAVEEGLTKLSDRVLGEDAPAVLAALQTLPPIKVAPFRAGAWDRQLLTEVLTATGLSGPVSK